MNDNRQTHSVASPSVPPVNSPLVPDQHAVDSIIRDVEQKEHEAEAENQATSNEPEAINGRGVVGDALDNDPSPDAVRPEVRLMGNGRPSAPESSLANEQQGVLTRDVKILSGGFRRMKGGFVSRGDVGDAVWNAWVEEGIVQLPTHVTANPHTIRNVIRRSKKPVVE